jgi:extracellular factor (EF) 3-hydroxypalmitic acid methyl ester biosynthesis protein
MRVLLCSMKTHENSPGPSVAESDSIILCSTSQGYTIRATPLRITRDVVVFEVYNPYSILQLSEVLLTFRIVVNDQLIYSGRATVSSLVNTGIMLVCEASLEEGWSDMELLSLVSQPDNLRADFRNFLHHCERIHSIQPDYKIVVADMQHYFTELKRWLEHVELGIRSLPSNERSKTESSVINELAPSLLPSIDSLFSRFEETAAGVPVPLLPSHRNYAKRQLHPHLLCSPFAYRTYHKPLGYAGDYEMVNMILRDPIEGSSLFSKIINAWFLSQSPAGAHRNRISYLTDVLLHETQRASRNNKVARILNLGCGPAREIQNFLIRHEICNEAKFVLLDFNEETIQHTSRVLEHLKTQYNRKTNIEVVKKSVHHILKQAHLPTTGFDMVYCAGIFDYLSDRICKQLMNIFYELLEPGGLLVATNVESSNPSRNGMEYLLEWHLIHRTRSQLRALVPDRAPQSSSSLATDETGINIYLEVRKPNVA